MNTEYRMYSWRILLAGFDNKDNAIEFTKQMIDAGERVHLTRRWLDRLTWREELVSLDQIERGRIA